MINALVVDLEHWHSSEFLTKYLPEELVDQVPESVRPILDLLDKHETKATFAVLGSVAEQHPELVKEIYDKGHEIASHAWSHKTLHKLGKDAFEVEIKKSVELLRSITGEQPIGFRAPSFSIDNTTKWAFEVLEKFGFKYDASVFPIKTMLYGLPDAPVHIYRPSIEDVTKDNPNGKIIEFPMTVLNIGKNIPLAGGFYLRVLPLWFLRYGIREVNKERPAIIYIHPWETYSKTPRLKVPLFSRFVTYYAINSALYKLEALLSEFNFKPIRDTIKGECNYY
ncbi:MAG: polysaccharide deacetylase family protein [Methanothrix sp.]|nr:polysaccharide deacetylase family protein [Methanothrix sp.]MDD4409676.1 polysaccharide deacetylase family protein [Candidatus Paceibacterota bacterium]